MGEFFSECGLKRIAIYGFGSLGKTFYEVIKNEKEVEIKYIIENNKGKWEEKCPVKFITSEEIDADIDVIVVTAINDYENIYKGLSGKISCRIFSMEDIVP